MNEITKDDEIRILKDRINDLENQLITADNESTSFMCDDCGCTEWLCGHNKRG